MICSKCKKQVQGHKSICPHCNSLFIPEVEKKTNNNQIRNNMSNLLEKEFSNNKDIFNVGGTVEGGVAPKQQSTQSVQPTIKRTKSKGLFSVVKENKKDKAEETTAALEMQMFNKRGDF